MIETINAIQKRNIISRNCATYSPSSEAVQNKYLWNCEKIKNANTLPKTHQRDPSTMQIAALSTGVYVETSDGYLVGNKQQCAPTAGNHSW